MDFTGFVKGIGRDLESGKYIIDLRVEEDVKDLFQKLNEKRLSIKISQYRKKRSLDANAYYWQLLTKIAEVLKTSKPFMHNQMLRKYGQLFMFDGKISTVTIPDTVEAERQVDEAETYHLKPTSQVRLGNDGVMYRTYKMLRGSSEYDAKEMSELIDGIVSEAKELGIETLTPDEIERLKNEWGINIAQKNKGL